MAMREVPLSPREKRLLRRLAAGKSDAQIAERIRGTAKQVAQQRARLLAKLGIDSQAEIAVAAERLASWSTYKGLT
ncbi:LuxR C-terminal-related transcriptional regulator [Bradyrhizobium sp. UFLA05-112]